MVVEHTAAGGDLLTLADSAERARPLCVWRADALCAIRHSLAGCVVAWCRDWGLVLCNQPVVDIVTGDGTADEIATQANWRAIPGTGLWWSFKDDSRSRVETTAPAGMALRAALFSRADGGRAPLLPEPAPIEREVAAAAWNDWWRRFTEHLGEKNAERVDETSCGKTGVPPNLQPWSGDLLIAMDWCGGRLMLRLDARHAACLASGASPECGASVLTGAQPRAGVPIEKAMAATRCRIRADLGEVELSLGQLHELALGDVIPLPHRLDHPATLRGPDGNPLCSGWLGQRDGNIAVELSRMQRPSDAHAGLASR